MTAAMLPREVALIERLAAGFARSGLQLNGRHQSDAELISLPGGAVLALTTDSIVEEIETGLYQDPFLIGWMTVTVNASDLAAVGAAPLGILLNQTLTHDTDADFLARMQQGVAAACAACTLPVLGGDTNVGSRLQVGASAVGLIQEGRPVTRLGARPGDHLFASGRLGSGGGYALARMEPLGMLCPSRAAGPGGRVSEPYPELPASPTRQLQRTTGPTAPLVQRFPGGVSAVPFRPQARLREGQILRCYASACMDTSDGVIPTLDELGRLNQVGFTLDPDAAFDPAALALVCEANLPAWALLAGPHGEFELLFTVPPDRLGGFEQAAAAAHWTPVPLGRVLQDPGLLLRDQGRWKWIDTRRVRDLFSDVGGDVTRYLAGLLAISNTN
ncbi:MAG: thiamine-monophosphate kinase [Gemmatimonadetes bacterium]|nr:thiamine-monophosphate kinase [Gemmatimonadota bacterium]